MTDRHSEQFPQDPSTTLRSSGRRGTMYQRAEWRREADPVAAAAEDAADRHAAGEMPTGETVAVSQAARGGDGADTVPAAPIVRISADAAAVPDAAPRPPEVAPRPPDVAPVAPDVPSLVADAGRVPRNGPGMAPSPSDTLLTRQPDVAPRPADVGRVPRSGPGIAPGISPRSEGDATRRPVPAAVLPRRRGTRPLALGAAALLALALMPVLWMLWPQGGPAVTPAPATANRAGTGAAAPAPTAVPPAPAAAAVPATTPPRAVMASKAATAAPGVATSVATAAPPGAAAPRAAAAAVTGAAAEGAPRAARSAPAAATAARTAAAPARAPAVARTVPVVAPGSPAATAARPAAARATAGEIRITSTPPGARVTVNGLGWGQTPLTVRNLAFGSQTVRLTSDGYRSEQRTVQVTGAQPQITLNVALRPAP